MHSSIFGREREIETLTRLLHSTKPEFLAIYGRRRVGKTYLIHEFFKDKGVYFCITGTRNNSKQSQIHKFTRELQNMFPSQDKIKEPKNWDDALYLLKDAVSKIDITKKVIIFFDELPWLASNRSGFLPALEYLWNQHFSRMNNVILVICGSAANWIIKKVINNKGGLYGRLSEIIKLHSFTLTETRAFLLSQHVQLSRKQLVECYMCMGGIAKYLTYIRPGESTAQIINRLCFTPQGTLTGEFNNLYQSLFNHAQVHIDIVKELAKHKSGIAKQQLLDNLQITSGGQTTLILEELEEAGFITACPEFQKTGKGKRLWLIDEYSYFYLNWMEHVKWSIILGNDQDYWLKMQNDPQWKTWSGYAFESICFKHIAQIKKSLGIAALLTRESQWVYKPKDKSEKGAQIDLIIDRKDDCINLCEIKFHHGTFTIDRDYAKELEHKINVFREQTKTRKTIFLTLITPFGLHKNEYSRELVQCELTLDDFFKD
ncbi:MAG: ATP-binding protein [Chlamydiales bacterium]|nr:ATP-binding protein [Chlamydiales bacterium]